MFKNHVTKELSAYCHGELADEDSKRISEHLLSCRSCRDEFEQIKLGVSLANHLPLVSAPESMWSEIEALLDKEPIAAASQYFSRSSTKWLGLAAAAATLILVGISVVFYYYSRSPKASWEVISLDGAPVINSSQIDEAGRLAVGELLETDNASRAKIQVGKIGHVEVEPNTRIRLVETGSAEHRLSLERGAMSATIFAPPRIFFVETPSAVAVDLGCAYTLEVDDAGRSLLHVTLGWVALQLKDRESIVPAGASCETRKGIGPGTPYFKDASVKFKTALAKLDFEKEREDTLGIVLRESRERDSLTLWHLLSRLDETERSRVYDRLTELISPPEEVTRSGVLQLDRKMLDSWKHKLESIWLGE
jgi:hypothetical protein